MTLAWWIVSRMVWICILMLGVIVVWLFVGIDFVIHGTVRSYGLAMALFFGGLIAVSLSKLVNLSAWKYRGAHRDPLAQLALGRTWMTTISSTLGLLMMAAACGHALHSGLPDDTQRGLASLGLLTCLAAAFGSALRHRATSLILSTDGLDYNAFGTGLIPWRDIRAVEIGRFLRTRVVALHLRNEAEYLRRGFKSVRILAHWMRRFVPSPFFVLPEAFEVSPTWLKTAIAGRLSRFGVPESPPDPTVQRQGRTP